MNDQKKWDDTNWKKWKEDYDTHSIDKRAEVYDLKHKLYPNKTHYHLASVLDFFYKIKVFTNKLTVIEFGGGKGELARNMFKTEIPITRWDNYEISEVAVNNSFDHPKYNALWLAVQPWKMRYYFPDYNVCIMSDFIEHIKQHELKELINKLKTINFFYIKSPLQAKTINVNWKIYQTHVLEIGWDGVEKLFKGYNMVNLGKGVRMFYRPVGTKDIRTHQSCKYIEDKIKLPAISIGNGEWNIKIINPEIKTLDFDTKYKPDYAEDFEETTLQSETFNTVICLNVIEHTKHPYKIIENAYKILKPNGILIISTPFLMELHEKPKDYWRFTEDGLVLLCEECGFTRLHTEYINNKRVVRGVFKK